MQTKFYGDASQASKRSALRTAARFAMSNLKSDVHFYMLNGTSSNVSNPFDPDTKEYKELEDFYETNGDFFSYFDSASYVLAEESDNREGHLQVVIDKDQRQMLRLYFSLGESKADKIEYVFQDFNIGVSFSVTSEGWAQWFADQLVRAGIVEEQMEKAEGERV